VASWTFALRAAAAAAASFAWSFALERPVTPGAVAAGVLVAATGSALGLRKSIQTAMRPMAAMRTILMGGEIWLTVPHIGKGTPDP
jgi:hypothetical protein